MYIIILINLISNIIAGRDVDGKTFNRTDKGHKRVISMQMKIDKEIQEQKMGSSKEKSSKENPNLSSNASSSTIGFSDKNR